MLNLKLQTMLDERNLPPILVNNDGTACDTKQKWPKRKKEILEIFEREVFGKMPQAPTDTKYEILSTYSSAAAGFAVYYRIKISFTTPKGPFSFEADMYIPRNVINVPCIVHLQFNDSPLHRVYPVEDIVKRGFATILVRYNDIMPDTNDFSKGLAGMYIEDVNNRKPEDWGAIGCWAFASSRVMDVIEQIDSINSKRVALVGHSRLGKTTMWCIANDDRFNLAVINASGNTGAALSRGNEGERIEYIVKHFPHWFTTNYYKYAGNEDKLPLDQHQIIAAIAPVNIYICSGNLDLWAAPKSEFLSAFAASEVFELLGKKGLVTPDELPVAETFLSDGDIAYSIHEGSHYIGSFEWKNIMDYMIKIGKK